jgi:3-hydroxyisobutyrate dehydrogenase
VSVIDAPVSGGNKAATDGTLAVLLGGEPGDIDRWRPVLATFAASTERLGGVGAGQLCKLVNNCLSVANLAAALRAVDVAEALGLDRDAATKVFAASSGDSFMLRVVPHMTPPGLELAADRYDKDVGLFEQLAGSAGADAEALAVTAREATSYLDTLRGTPAAR